MGKPSSAEARNQRRFNAYLAESSPVVDSPTMKAGREDRRAVIYEWDRPSGLRGWWTTLLAKLRFRAKVLAPRPAPYTGEVVRTASCPECHLDLGTKADPTETWCPRCFEAGSTVLLEFRVRVVDKRLVRDV